MEKIFNLEFVENKKTKLPWKSYELSTTATTADVVRGSASQTVYGLQPMGFLKKAVDAAKERMRFLEVVQQVVMSSGHKYWSIPKRDEYMADGDWESSDDEYAAGSEIAWTDITTPDSVIFTPTTYNYGVALSNKAIRETLLPMVSYCNEELSYKYENSIDSSIRDALFGTCTTGTATEPTPMSNSVNGAQTIFGGDADDQSDALDVSDVLTPELIKKAKRLLMSKAGYYWSTNTHTKSAVTKNPWSPTDNEPFVLFVAPEQMESLMNDSQFTNAAEFGSQGPVLTGQIAKYCGVNIVETTKVPDFTDNDNIDVQASNITVDVDGHICGLVKAQRCGAIVWGKKAEFKTFDWPISDQVRMTLGMAYQAQAVHPDAIVRLVVSDT